MDAPGAFMQALEKSGFIGSFLVQDTLGMTVPRTREGLYRDVPKEKRKNVKDWNFKEGAEVHLFDAKNLPEYLDFSQCSEVYLSECNMMGVKKVKFRDREQKDRFMFEAKYFFGNVIYGNSLFSRIKKRFGPGGMGE